MASKGTPLDDFPIESWHRLLKKEALYKKITSLEEWIEFYNTKRIKNRK